MLDSLGRNLYDKVFLNKVVQYFENLSPSLITLAGCGIGVFAAILIALGWANLALLFLIVSGLFDTLDGAVARKKKLDSPAGCVLDIFCDRIVEVAIVLGLYVFDPTRALIALMMMGSIVLCITAFLVVSTFLKREGMKSFTYSFGIMERTEAFLFFIAMCCFPSWYAPLAICFSVLVTFSAFYHVFRFITFSKRS